MAIFKKNNQQPPQNDAEAKRPNPLRHLRPRLVPLRLSPFKQQFENVSESSATVSGMARSLRPKERLCPNCKTKLTFIAKTADANAHMKCATCDFEQVLRVDPDQLVHSAAHCERQATKHLIAAVCVLAIGAVITVLNHNVFTLIGSGMLFLFLFLISLLHKYKAWQYENDRLFEEAPPIKEWLKSLMSSG